MVIGRAANKAGGTESLEVYQSAYKAEERAEAGLVRCIFGNPFRLTSLSPSWLAWNDGRAAQLAADIYRDRTFGLMPMLADVLEDAGCEDVAILNHCREPGEHVRGCWVVDLLLGKS